MVKKLTYGLLKKLKFLNPEFYVKIYYEYYTGKKLDLNNPVEFNQKVQWLKVYYQPPILNKLVDKYAVREYVKEKVGEKYLNGLLAVYDKVEEVNFKELPDQFVVKGVHGCHFNLIVSDKSTLKLSKANRLMRKWMGRNYYYRGGLEWAYKDVKPRLVVEEFMEEPGKDVLNDYKFFCFDGKPKFIQIDMERGIHNYRCYYDLNWKKLPFYTQKNKFYEGEVEKPANLTEMIEVAEKLADKFPFVRVDLYSVKGKTIFGEMTFYPTDGRKEFIPEEYNKIIGDYLTLPKRKEGEKIIKRIV